MYLSSVLEYLMCPSSYVLTTINFEFFKMLD